MAVDGLRHPDAGRLAEYAEGLADHDERAMIEAHLADCADCRTVVLETTLYLESHPESAVGRAASDVVWFRSRRWAAGVAAGLAVAAACVLAVRVVRPGWLDVVFGRTDRPELQELIAAVAHEPTRPVEGRLTGNFPYAPPPSVTRGPGLTEVRPDVRIAAAKIEQAAASGSPNGFAALGVALLATGDLDHAIASLERAVALQPDARYLSDLAAAYAARGRRRAATADWSAALTAAERALRADSTLLEAWFNRALAVEALQSAAAAGQAWDEYRRRDPSSGWSRERSPN